MRVKSVVIAGAIAALLCLPLIGQKKPRTALDGVYTADQAKRGLEAWQSKCALCHGGDMQGGPEAPAMVGEPFLFSYGGKPVSALYDYIHTNMPPEAPGSIADQRYADIIAAIFQKNEFPAGNIELIPDKKFLDDIVIPKEKP
jgi:mono/diheme cytochrome c family protein